MKKILCLVVALMLLCCAALAESEKEITFQGVPWRSTLADTYDTLLKKGFFSKEYDKFYGKGIKNLSAGYVQRGSSFWGNFYLTGEEGVGVAEVAAKHKPFITVLSGSPSRPNVMSLLENDLKIAGYEVNYLYIYYAGHEKDTELISVMVRLNVGQGEEAFNDLTTKLTTLYGEYTQIEVEKTNSTGYLQVFDVNDLFGMNTSDQKNVEICHAWQGAGNTAVVLKPAKSSSGLIGDTGSYTIDIIYGTLEAPKILDDYCTKYPSDTSTVPAIDITNLSGL